MSVWERPHGHLGSCPTKRKPGLQVTCVLWSQKADSHLSVALEPAGPFLKVSLAFPCLTCAQEPKCPEVTLDSAR